MYVQERGGSGGYSPLDFPFSAVWSRICKVFNASACDPECCMDAINQGFNFSVFVNIRVTKELYLLHLDRLQF